MKIELETAKRIAGEVVAKLSPYCSRIEVAGSIRRRKSLVKDVDIVLIPSDPWNLESEVLALARPFRPKLSGEKLKRFNYNGAQIDLYFTDEKTFGMILLVRTGSTEHNKKLIAIAKRRGLYFSVARGIENERGEVIASKTEKEVFSALGLNFIPPEERE